MMFSVSKYTIRALLLLVLTAPLSLTAVAQDAGAAAILTPPAGPAPKINGPRVFGVRPGHPLLFTIPATGNRPMTFAAKHLPAGVKLDKRTGRLSGAVAQPGEYTITLYARNKQGHASRDLKLVVGEKIALTPPMGWNSWNVYGTKVTQQKVLDNAKAMVSTGLINHGWSYMNIDDAWQGKRGGKDNAIQPDPETFPGMQQLASEVHGLGLKIGIYSTPWVESYGHHVGGSANNPEGAFERTKENVPRNRKLFPYAIGKYTFVKNDVKQWAEWGIDYLKYDWNPNEMPETKEMYDALRNSGRDIFLSLSNSTPFGSIAQLSTVSNSWRTGGDIRDNWKSLKSRLFSQDKWAPYAGPGHWNDLDMMIVGYLGWGKDLHPTKLTPDEQYTHMSAWCLMSVPLLLGCDITKMDAFTLSLLSNDEVIALNQDPLGKQATVITHDDDTGIMAKDLADGAIAAGLFNIGDNGSREMTLKWEDLHISGPYIVRDLWRQKDIGTFEGSFKTTVAQHGVVLVSLRKAGSAASQPGNEAGSLNGFPKGSSPQEIGRLVAGHFIASPHGNFGNGKQPSRIIYPETCTWFGALEFADNAQDSKMIRRLRERLDRLVKDEPSMIPTAANVDNSVFGIVPLELYRITGEASYLELGQSFADRQWSLPLTVKPHYQELLNKGLSWQTRMWIDDMFMITALQVQAYRATKDERYINRAAKEMAVYLDSLQRPNGLFYHAPDVPFFWGRGNGWVAVGMTDLLKYLPENNTDRNKIMAAYKNMMTALKEYQDKNGMWHQLIDDADAWPETSCTGMFAYAMICGVRNGWLDEQAYAPVARQAWLGLVSYINRNGDISDVCEGTNKKNNKQYYLDRRRITGDMHGQAPVLWCAAALLDKKE